MNRKIFQLVFFGIILVSFGVIIKNYVDSIESDISDYALVLDQVPHGEVSRISPIIINLAQDIDGQRFPINLPLKNEIIKFHPSIEGYAYFTDKRTLEFHPNEPLKPGQNYAGNLDINKIFPSFNFKPFHFKFQTPPLTFKVKITETVYYDTSFTKTPYVKGHITFNDYVEFEKKQKLLAAYQHKENLPIVFFSGKDNLSIEFRITNIQRTQSNENIVIHWTGKAINSKEIDSTFVSIPSSDSFKISYSRMVYFPNPILTLRFTDIIDKKSLLDSVLQITNFRDYNMQVANNEINIEFHKTSGQHHFLLLSKDLRNLQQVPLSSDFKFPFSLEPPKPVIELVDSSNFRLSSELFSAIGIHALNLKSIDLSITFVPDKNMMQFLQVNNINGFKEIDRVGNVIYQNTFNLQTDINYAPNQLITYNLNLLGADISKNGLYSFAFSFDPDNIVFRPDSMKSAADTPQHSAPFLRHNIIYSNILAIAKYTSLDSLYIFVSDTKLGKPLKTARIEIYNYQQNKLATLLSDEQGVGKIKIHEKNLFIKVQHKNQTTYLKLHEQNQLSDTFKQKKGSVPQKGTLCYVEGLNASYKSADSIKIGIIIKKNGRYNFLKEPLEIKLESPDHFFFSTKITTASSSSVNFYGEKLPRNCTPGIWKIIVSNQLATFEYPFRVLAPSNLTLPVQFTFNEKKRLLTLQAHSKITFLNQQPLIVEISPQINTPKNKFPAYNFNAITSESDLKKEIITTSFDKNGKATIDLSKILKPGIFASIASRAILPHNIELIKDTLLYFSDENHWLGINSDIPGDTTLEINLLYLDNLLKESAASGPVKIEVIILPSRPTEIPHIEFTDTLPGIAGSHKWVQPLHKFPHANFKIKATLPAHNIHTFSDPITIHQIKNKPNTINFYTDKTQYHLGDSCYIYFNSPRPASALISVETNLEVFMSQWVQCAAQTKVMGFKVSENLLPGFFISFLNHSNEDKQTSSKYLWVTNDLENPDQKIEVYTPHDWIPGSEIPILISNNKGVDLDYFISISAYDSADTEEISSAAFFQLQRYNTNTTWISKSTYTNELTSALQSNVDYRIPENNPVSHQNKGLLLLGPFNLNAQSKTTHTLKVPDTQGLLDIKVMGVQSQNGQVFEIKKMAEINRSFNLVSKIPAYLNAGDLVSFPLAVENNSLKPDTFKIEFSNFTNLQITSPLETTLIIKEKSTKGIVVSVLANLNREMAAFEISVLSSQSKQTNTYKIPIAGNPNHLIRTTSTLLPPQRKWQQTIAPMGIKGANTAILEISDYPIPTIWELMQGLHENNTKNLEQLINETFPLIYLLNTLDEQALKTDYSQRILRILNILPAFQARNGGFTNKLTDKEPNTWLTSYAGAFMLAAQDNKFTLNEGVFNKWIRFQQREFQKIKYAHRRNNRNSAYLIYTLSQAHAIEMKQLSQFEATDTLEIKYSLALAYAGLAEPKLANALIKPDSIIPHIKNLNMRESSLLLHISTELEIKALALPLLHHLNELMQKHSSHQQDVALALNSILKALAYLKSDHILKLNYQVNNGKETKYTIPSPLWYLNIPIEFTLSKNIDLTNYGKDTMYINLSHQGNPQQIAPGQFNIDKLQVSNQYLNLDNSPVNTKNLMFETYYKQRIAFKNLDYLSVQNLSVSMPIPAGVEIVYSSIPFESSENLNLHGLVQTQILLKPLELQEVILIYKPVFRGEFISYPIKTTNNNFLFSKTFTPLSKLTIR